MSTLQPRLAAPPHTLDLELLPEDNTRLANLCGPLDGHLRQIERRLGIEIANRGQVFRLIGDSVAVTAAEERFHSVFTWSAPGPVLFGVGACLRQL